MATKEFNNTKFKRLRFLLGFNQAQFAEKMNSSQQIIAMIENNKRGIPSSMRESFYKYFNISIEEALQCETQEELASLLNHKAINKYSIDSANNIVAIPFYNETKVAAGTGEMLPSSSTENSLYFDKRWLENILGVKADKAIIIQAKGTSMDSGLNKIDDIKNDDLLLIDTSIKEVINNKIFVIQQNNELRVKRLKKEFTGELYLISNNDKEFPPEEVTTETYIIGKVVWNGSKENI